MTEEVVLYAMDGDCDVFLYIPDENKTDKVCKLAIQKNFSLIREIPKEKLTENIILEAVRWPLIEVLKEIPDHLFTENVWKKAISHWQYSTGVCLPFLSKIPSLELFEQFYNEFKNKYDGDAFKALKYLPDRLWTEQFADKVSLDGAGVLEYIPERYLTPERYTTIAHNSEEFLDLIPESKRTEEICTIALLKSLVNIDYIPQKIGTREFFSSLVEKQPYILNLLPDYLDKKDIYREFISLDPIYLKYIPENYRTHDLCELAIDKAFTCRPFPDEIFEYIPYTDLQVKAMQEVSNPDIALEIYLRIPNKYGNVDLLEEGCKKNADVIGYAPKELLNQEICIIAIDKDPSAIRSVPSKLRTPELWLHVRKADPTYPIPNEISLGNNIYTFSRNLEKLSQKEFSIEQIKAMYDGLPFPIRDLIPGVETQTSQIKWDKNENRFVAEPKPEQPKLQKKRRL
ncbi:MAG: DUF4116 domain-containing protein [Bacteroides sp.]|nr:DUF4116 domain-containing protein [Bacteroides sp.]